MKQGNNSIPGHLEALFREIRDVATKDPADFPAENRFNGKGDRVKWFDIAADQAVRTYLDKQFHFAVRLLSEEGEPQVFGKGDPEFTMVLDPVDGSDNFDRGLGFSGMSIALIPAGAPLAVGTVQYALVGDLLTGQASYAKKGSGAFLDGQRIHTRAASSQLGDAFISCELNHFEVNRPLSSVLPRSGGIRAFGCATRALALVAQGALDAHLDLRGRLTAENFLGAALILAEAGGLITDVLGKALPEIHTLTERYSIIASGTDKLHEVLLKELGQLKICRPIPR